MEWEKKIVLAPEVITLIFHPPPNYLIVYHLFVFGTKKKKRNRNKNRKKKKKETC